MLIGHSLSESALVLCPACAHPFDAEVWLIVDAQERPDLQAAILDGSISALPCPACGSAGAITAPLLYHDGASERMVLALPMSVASPETARELVSQMHSLFLDALPEKPDPLPVYASSVELVAELDGLQALLGAPIDPLTPALEALLAAEDGEGFQRVLVQYRTTLMQPHVDSALEQVIEQADATSNPVLGRRARDYRATLARFRTTWQAWVGEALAALQTLDDLDARYAEVLPALEQMLTAVDPQAVYAARISLTPEQQARVDVLLNRLLAQARDQANPDLEAYLRAVLELKKQ